MHRGLISNLKVVTAWIVNWDKAMNLALLYDTFFFLILVCHLLEKKIVFAQSNPFHYILPYHITYMHICYIAIPCPKTASFLI